MWPLQGFEIHFQKLIWLPHCFIKAIKSVYLAWFISPDRLSYTFQHAFPPPALCAGMYLFFFFFLSSCIAPIHSLRPCLECYLLCEVPPSHFPGENHSPLYSHKTRLPVRAPSQDVSLKWFVLWTLPSQGPWFTHLCVCQHNYCSQCHSFSTM